MLNEVRWGTDIFSVCQRPPIDWESAEKVASTSVGKVTCRLGELGCGVLIGIDRVILPAHLLEGSCLAELAISFNSRDFCFSFGVLSCIILDTRLDCCVLQLSKNSCGYYPGNYFPIAQVSKEIKNEGFVVGRGEGSTEYFEGGYSCYSSHFCSKVPTVSGSSGEGYFNKLGQLFAIHLSRASGLCEGIKEERQALLLEAVVRKYPRLFDIEPCISICSRQAVNFCFSNIMPLNPCVIPERHGNLEALWLGSKAISTVQLVVFDDAIRFFKGFNTAEKKIDLYSKMWRKNTGTLYQLSTYKKYGSRLDSQPPPANKVNIQLQVGGQTLATVIIGRQLQEERGVYELTNYVLRKFEELTYFAKKKNKAGIYEIVMR